MGTVNQCLRRVDRFRRLKDERGVVLWQRRLLRACKRCYGQGKVGGGLRVLHTKGKKGG